MGINCIWIIWPNPEKSPKICKFEENQKEQLYKSSFFKSRFLINTFHVIIKLLYIFGTTIGISLRNRSWLTSGWIRVSHWTKSKETSKWIPRMPHPSASSSSKSKTVSQQVDHQIQRLPAMEFITQRSKETSGCFQSKLLYIFGTTIGIRLRNRSRSTSGRIRVSHWTKSKETSKWIPRMPHPSASSSSKSKTVSHQVDHQRQRLPAMDFITQR